MELVRQSPPASRLSAFSLPEVTMATGIVAAVVLPLLAMLAGAGAMRTTARDRETSARLAKDLVASLVPLPGGRLEMAGPGGRSPLGSLLDGNTSGTTFFFACDGKGSLHGTTDEAVWRAGIAGETETLHLVQMRLTPLESEMGGTPSLRLYRLDVTISHPARSPEQFRRHELFTSSLSVP